MRNSERRDVSIQRLDSKNKWKKFQGPFGFRACRLKMDLMSVGFVNGHVCLFGLFAQWISLFDNAGENEKVIVISRES